MPLRSVFEKYLSPTAARVIPLTDFDQATSFFPSWQGRFEQISAGQFAGTLRIAKGELVRVVQVDANQRISLQGRDAAGMFSVYPVIASNSTSVWQGRRLAPGQLVVHGPQAETNHFTSRRTEDLGLSLRPEVLAEAIRLLLRTDDANPSATWSVFGPSPEHFATLNQRMAQLLSTGVADPTLLGSPEGRGLEQECIRSLVATLDTTSISEKKLTLQARARLIRHAEEFMRSRLADPFGVIDLCRELGVSDRTLRLAFRERFGVGPMVYFRCLRLNAVRSSLKADPGIAIGDVAQQFGFHHLGHFAADYRHLFGDRPSAKRR